MPIFGDAYIHLTPDTHGYILYLRKKEHPASFWGELERVADYTEGPRAFQILTVGPFIQF